MNKPIFRKYRRKVYYTLGDNPNIAGCFIVKAFTPKGLYMKVCSKSYDLQMIQKSKVYIHRVEVL